MKYDWKQFEDDVTLLSKQIASNNFQFDHILAIERGGVYIGNIIKKYYPHVKYRTVIVSCYTDQEKRHIPIVKGDFKFPKNSKILLLDELIETGETISIVKSLIKNCEIKVGVLINKLDSKIIPDFCVHEKVDLWCEFPWETT